MMLRTLRETTRPHHQRIEQNHRLAVVLRPALTREDYVAVLARFYGFIKPLEEQLLRECTAAGCGALLDGRLKTTLLERDLASLGVGADALRRLPLCVETPVCERMAQCMGILYVFEGSTLGGQVIATAVKNSLGLDAGNGCAYFHGYGPSTRTMWKDTCRILEEYGQVSPTELGATVAAAAETFDRLNQWFQTT